MPVQIRSEVPAEPIRRDIEDDAAKIDEMARQATRLPGRKPGRPPGAKKRDAVAKPPGPKREPVPVKWWIKPRSK